MIEFKLNGGRELHDILQRLPVDVETKALRSAMGKAARALRNEVRAMAPLESGDMKKAIKSTRKTKKGQVIARVKMLGKHSFLGVFMEYGVSPHLITAKDGGVLRIGRNTVGKSVMHPGHVARPFMRPALDTNAAKVITLVAEFIRDHVDTYFEKLGQMNVPDEPVDVEEDA